MIGANSMITGINLNETQEFISKYDTAEQKTIWKIGPLSSGISAHIGSIFAKDPSSIDGFIKAVKFGLKGAENFKNASGEDIVIDKVNKSVAETKYQIVANNVIEIIPFEIIIELGTAILNSSKLSEQETKN